jgi:integrase
MTQRPLGLFDHGPGSESCERLIAAFRAARLRSPHAESTVAAEVSQLRSLAKDARERGGSLNDLLAQPALAARLIGSAGRNRTYSTMLTRSRSVQKLALQQLGDSAGRAWIGAFRASSPKRDSRGWHDEGLSLPGTRTRTRMSAPTPDADAIDSILETAVAQSAIDGAIGGLACFSGLELGEIAELRWCDVRWQDQSGSPFCEVSVQRRGHRTTCFVVARGARALLSLAMASGLQLDAYVFHGRTEGQHLSKGATRDRLRLICKAAGWPGLSRSQLTSAFAMWLRARDFNDHYILLALGRRRAATVDRLLRNQEGIAAQMLIDSRLLLGRGS